MTTPNVKFLYKKSKKGDKFQIWGLEVDGNKFRSHEGFLDGTISIGEWTSCEGKNIGRSNETTPNMQALLEANSRYQKKVDKGYSYDITDCERPFEPTLAHVWEDYEDKVTFPVQVAPKLDGVRCLYRKGKLWTRNGKEIVSCPHIIEELKELGVDDKDWDGELYNHALKDDFNKIVSLVKKTKPTLEDLQESKKIVQYHVFDYVSDEPFNSRYFKLHMLLYVKSNIVIPVPHKMAKDIESIRHIQESCELAGYEGAMVRWGNEGYHQGRTKHLLKCKQFQDAEFPVVDMLEGRGKREATLGKWVVKLPDGTTNEVGPTGTDSQNFTLWKQRKYLIGKVKITVKYQGYTPDGKLRFPTFKAIREED